MTDGYKGEGETPSTTIATVTWVSGTHCGIAYGGNIFEAEDVYGLGVTVANTVLADYLPSSRQWAVVAILT